MSAAQGRTVDAQALQTWTRDVLVAAGAAEPAAVATAEVLVHAHRVGLDTHGVSLLRMYLPQLRAGAIDGRAEPVTVSETDALAVIDGCNALGPYVAMRGIRIACGKAEAGGVGVSAIANSNHFATASAYTTWAARAGCVAIVLSNSDPGLAPLGALRPILGTNPIAIAAPPGDRAVMPSLDMATSVTAAGRLHSAQRAGERLPAGWAIGPDGLPTDDPVVAMQGSMLPLGGHKGFALAAMVDLLAGCLTGANISPDIPGEPSAPQPQGTGHLLIALKVSAFAGERRYRDGLDRLADAVHQAPRRADASPFLLPGEPEAAVAAERAGRVPFDPGTAALLADLGVEYGVRFPA